MPTGCHHRVHCQKGNRPEAFSSVFMILRRGGRLAISSSPRAQDLPWRSVSCPLDTCTSSHIRLLGLSPLGRTLSHPTPCVPSTGTLTIHLLLLQLGDLCPVSRGCCVILGVGMEDLPLPQYGRVKRPRRKELVSRSQS